MSLPSVQCGKGGQWREAGILFEKMSEARSGPDVVSYNAAISACEKGGQWREALILLETLTKARLS